MIIRKKILLLVLLTSICGCVDFSRLGKDNFDAYSRHQERALSFIVKKDYKNARLHLAEALIIGRNLQYTDGVVVTKQRFANTYTLENKFIESEFNLLDAKQICNSDSSCSSKLMGSVFYDLIWLQAYHMKNIERTEQTVEEVIKLQSRLGKDKTLKSRLIEYAGIMTHAGFEAQAVKLAERAKSL